jgi:mono/diheme cytochrome c family protein
MPARRLLAVVCIALAVAGCGGSEEVSPTAETVEGTTETAAPSGRETESTPEESKGVKGDPAAGKQIFADQGCGSCHTLADAGTSGNIGPNLDDAKPTFDLVVDRVTNGKGVMPSFKGQLSPAEIDAVATYVSSVAGK